LVSRRPPPSWLLAALLAAIYLVVDPPSADLAAQTYRTWLFEHAGFVVWDNGWYAGHHNPAYSILFPPLSAWTSPQLVGAVAAVVSAWGFERIATTVAPRSARPASYWFATATLVSLVTGRLTFALGLALAILAVLALTRDRLGWCAIAGAASALASPVAAAFLALVLVAWGATRRRWIATAALLGAALAPAAALSVCFPEGGSFPFVAAAFWPTLAGTLLVIAVLWRSASTPLRVGLALYALLLLVSEALSTPMGGNAVRLGAVFAGPIAALTLWPDRRRALALLVLPLVYWQVSAPANDVWRAHDDPSVNASYYDHLLTFLEQRRAAEGPLRIEIPFTADHWESARVAGGPAHIPLARGWERQLDRKLNGLFYDGTPLTADRYRAWLDDNAVRYVALADAPLDYSATAEASLIRGGGAPYLREVFHDAHWRVFAVDAPAPLADHARVTDLDADRVDLVAPRAATVHLRVRYSPYWHITRGHGCVVKDGDWTALTLTAGGAIRVSARFALDRVGATSPRCST
jgi:hypothetical protein